MVRGRGCDLETARLDGHPAFKDCLSGASYEAGNVKQVE